MGNNMNEKVTPAYIKKESKRIGVSVFEHRAARILLSVNGPKSALDYLAALEEKLRR